MRKATLIFSLIICVNISAIFSQQYPRQNIDFQAFVQNIIGNPTDGLNYEDLLESLSQLYINPLDLNKANRAQLANLYLLTDKQINSFIIYRENAGLLASIYELQVVEGFDLNTIYKILPFVTISNTALSGESIENSIKNANQYFILRTNNVLEQKKGFSPLQGRETVRYLGSPGSVYMRYKMFNSNDISAGFTLEKDDGESFKFNTKKHQYGADFNSAHFQIQNKGNWKNITLGDYTMSFGQGIVLASGFYLGKGAETILTVRRNSLGIRPYASVIEQNFFRGGAATYKAGQFELTGFFSAKRRTANFAINKTTNNEYVTSFDTDGYHRTASELADKNVLLETSAGFNIKWENIAKNLTLELTDLHSHYDLPLIKADKLYNKFEFSGKNQQITSLSYSYIINNLNFFGETARSKSGGIGTVNGLIMSLSRKSDLSFVFRKYDKNFHSLYSNSFGENSRNINEIGAYVGYKYSPSRRWVYTTSFDYFKFPYLKFGVDGPSDGIEFLHRLAFNPTKTTHWYIQYRQQQKGLNLKTDKTTEVTNTIRQNMVLHFDKPIGSRWAIKTNILGSAYRFAPQKNTYGVAFVQDFGVSLRRLSFDARLAYFNAVDYDNRLYIYEQDVLYAFSFPAYYGKGFRHYLLTTYKPSKAAEIQLKWGRSDYFGQDNISSGLEEIAKPHKSEIKMQVKWNW
jgi:Helix-hairpin-helix motif